MVFNFSDFKSLLDNIVLYFTGSYPMTALFICLIFLLVLISRGLDIRYATIFTVPLLGFFVAIGWFGTITNNQWIINIALIIVSIIYGTAIIKLTT